MSTYVFLGTIRFLLLMTQGLYGALEEATNSDQANKEIVQYVVEQFGSQSTITGVAQGVVDRIVRIHHDRYMKVSLTCFLLFFYIIQAFLLNFLLWVRILIM